MGFQRRRWAVRRYLLCRAGLIAALYFAAGAVASGQATLAKLPAEETCKGDFGTSVKFLPTPSEAAKQALKDQKLVVVLHVSGDFEDPDFT
jgi:hypothetical protein